MSFKSFIIASVLIHILGGIALYFYYNPIVLDKKPSAASSREKELKPAAPETTQESLEQEPSSKKLKQTSAPAPTPVKAKQKNRKKQALDSESRAFVKAKEETAKPVLQNRIEIIEDYKKAELESGQKEESHLKEEEPCSKEKPLAFSLLEQKPGNPALSYPELARRLEMEGTVSLLFFVDEKGLVEKIQLSQSSGHSELDNYVLRRLSQYRFLENKPCWTSYKQTFVLKGEEKELLRLRVEDKKEPEQIQEPEPSLLEKEIESSLESEEVEFIEYDSLEE